MNLMPAVGKFNSQLGGDNAATTVRGIARDSDFHSVSEGTKIRCAECEHASKLSLSGREREKATLKSLASAAATAR